MGAKADPGGGFLGQAGVAGSIGGGRGCRHSARRHSRRQACACWLMSGTSTPESGGVIFVSVRGATPAYGFESKGCFVSISSSFRFQLARAGTDLDRRMAVCLGGNTGASALINFKHLEN